MSCMEHACTTPGCDYAEFNNKLHPVVDTCPRCGGTEFSRHYDEAPERDEREVEEMDPR